MILLNPPCQNARSAGQSGGWDVACALREVKSVLVSALQAASLAGAAPCLHDHQVAILAGGERGGWSSTSHDAKRC